MNSMIRILSAIALLGASTFASAQATRTWVSGVGDDANPCSRTAPCKTFAGAISKTAARGKINVLDSGGFGAVTITKSITIEAEGTVAGMLATAGQSGVIINALPTDRIVLRNLKIEGIGTGGSGIRVLSAGAVLIEGTTIEDFTTHGIDISPTAASVQVALENVTLRRNGDVDTEASINLAPAATFTASVSLNGVRIDGGANGIRAAGAGVVDAVIRNSMFSALIFDGVRLTNIGTAVAMLDNVSIIDSDGTGVSTAGIGARARVANSTITGNAVGVFSTTANGIFSFGNNRLIANASGNTFPLTVALQ